ncbi:hypothetical protein ACH5RR_007425 [Cinchona calisaya]|uniref:Disease resistance protein At1g50180 n=1 Tax=Cinchona calisaya TaxID=153742 RepID=A0ABD3ARY0_9GENT
MAEAAVSLAAKTISNLLIEEAKFLLGVSDQVEQLHVELRRMQAFLKDADMRQHDEEIVKVWISQARDLAYAAEDLIESYAFSVASRRGNIFKRIFCILKECFFSHSIREDIDSLKNKLSNLTKSFQDYGIRDIMEREGGTSSLEQQLRRTYSHVIEDDFVGLEGDVELLVENLVMEDEIHHFRVVSIYGMGGLGKTTLAQKVYNHPRVKRYFDGYVWVCVSQKWQKEKMLQRILISLIPDRREDILKWRDEELVRQLFQIQRSKKYLLVLDDIWSTNAWKCIKQAFPITEKNGSKILLTTRKKEVAEQIGPNGFHHQLRLLSDDESWELLKMKAPTEKCVRENEDIQELEKLGKEMVKYCGGLPLAVIVLGGILASKKSLEEWEAVKKNIKAHLGRGNNLTEEEENVHEILTLSYDDLPHKLKPCFLYLSKIDEDSDIDVETLYQLWIAEGMISEKDCIGEELMMDVAERYLGEFVQRSMVQGKTPEVPTLFRYFSSCRLHDLMRDLSLRKAEEESFLLSTSCDDEKGNSSSSSLSHQQVYRLVIRLDGTSVQKFVPFEKRVTMHLRLLDFSVDEYGGRIPHTMISQFNQFKMLRVLAFQMSSPVDVGVVVDVDDSSDQTCKEIFDLLVDDLKLRKAIGKLIHLRYMRLSDRTFVCFPSSIANLQHLQTLDLRDISVLRIPNVLWKMRQLRYLYLPDDYTSSIGLFSKLKPFCKLRLDGLNKLEILENFCIPICQTKDISKLKNLRALSVQVCVDFGEDLTEIVQYISNSNHLSRTSLTLSVHEHLDGTSTEKLSAAIGQCFPCRNLQVLDVLGPIGNLPKYETHFCPALTRLKLFWSHIKEDPMKTLEMLPNLWSLEFSDWAFVGNEMRCTATRFPKLRSLALSYLPNLEKWWVDEGAMPNLSTLSIASCGKLEMIPTGLRSITTLKELLIKSMPYEFTARIQVVDGREGADFHKVSHIPSISIR